MSKKNDFLRCYVNGKKSALHLCGGSLYLLSYNNAFGGCRLENMRGFQRAMLLPSGAGLQGLSDLDELQRIVFTDLYVCKDIRVTSVAFEGSEEYAQIRANIRTYSKAAKAGRASTPAAAVPASEPVPAPAPAAVPAPAPAPAASDEIRHKDFDAVLSLVRASVPVYLYGPAGSGKNVLCEQVARALGLPFYYVNTVTQEYKITGFVDAGGRYIETEFYKAFKNGGVFMLDEMDASCPDALICLNAALANGYFCFPSGTVQAHPNFRVIAAGNTCGTGANELFTGRARIDAATLDRFAALRLDYDPRVEAKICSNSSILEFVRDLRRAADACRVPVVLGYRAISRLVQFAALGFPVGRSIDMAICKGMQKDDIRLLSGSLSCCNQYTKAFAALAE